MIVGINNNSGDVIIIEKTPEELLSQLELNLSSFKNYLEKIKLLTKNSNVYEEFNNNRNNNKNLKEKKYYVLCNIIDTYMNYIFSNNNYIYFNSMNISNNPYNNKMIIFEDNYFKKLIEKHLLIDKYFKALKIQYNKKNRNNKEYIQIKIIFRNLFIIYILFPFNLSKFYEKDYDKKIKIVVNGIYGPINTIKYDTNYNNSSNYKLYQKLSIIFKNKFKNILKNEIFLNFGKFSFFKGFIFFLDYIYDYNKIFKIKCNNCLNKIKYIKDEHYFSIPCYKITYYGDEYINNLINDIDKECKINKNMDKNNFKFFHEECINQYMN